MKKYRRFTEEFKRSLVPQIDSGAISKAAASRENNISPSLIERWQQQIHEGTMQSRPTVRADHLSCYGYQRLTTPNLDMFSQEGVVFKNAYATNSWTLPSHASIFTGL
jgi:hypothetical protein